MLLIDCELESKVQVYVKQTSWGLTLWAGPDQGAFLIEAILLAKDSRGNVFVGFATNMVVGSKSSQLISIKWWYAGIQYGQWVNGKCECVCEATTLKQIAIPTDGPCRQCSKKNEWDRPNCWWCNVSEPTNLNKVGP